MSRNQLLDFLQSQKSLVIATLNADNLPWVTNVYFSVNENFELFFVSPLDTNHSKHIKENLNVAFSTVWYEEENFSNRKGIQGTGNCIQIKNPIEIARHLNNHYEFFPSWKDTINLKSITEKIIQSRPFLIKPNYIKFWNDELYGDEGINEFNF